MISTRLYSKFLSAQAEPGQSSLGSNLRRTAANCTFEFRGNDQRRCHKGVSVIDVGGIRDFWWTTRDFAVAIQLAAHPVDRASDTSRNSLTRWHDAASDIDARDHSDL